MKFLILLILVALVKIITCQKHDKDMRCPEFIESRGFKAETHEVLTGDGYYLAIHRIVNPFVATKGNPVFLQHGLMGSSTGWIMNSPGPNAADSKDKTFTSESVGNNLVGRGKGVYFGIPAFLNIAPMTAHIASAQADKISSLAGIKSLALYRIKLFH